MDIVYQYNDSVEGKKAFAINNIQIMLDFVHDWYQDMKRIAFYDSRGWLLSGKNPL